jgi:hypothetical protein
MVRWGWTASSLDSGTRIDFIDYMKINGHSKYQSNKERQTLNHSLSQLEADIFSIVRIRCLKLLEPLDQILDLVWILGFDCPELGSVLTNKSRNTIQVT